MPGSGDWDSPVCAQRDGLGYGPRSRYTTSWIAITDRERAWHQTPHETYARKQKFNLNWKLRLRVESAVRFKPGNYRLFPSTKPEESERGTDLEIRIYDAGTKAAKLAVQAKKLYPPPKTKPYQIGKYQLYAREKSQMDILEDYSQKNDAIPLYLLYNYVDKCAISRYWHCCQCPPDRKQLGCTLVPSRNIRQAFENPKLKNFDGIHKSRGVLPWHCFFDCTQRRDGQGHTAARRILSLLSKSFSLSDDLSIDETVIPPSSVPSLPPSSVPSLLPSLASSLAPLDDEQDYDWVRFDPVEGAWPEWLWERPGTTLSAKEHRELWGDQKETVATPRHLLLVKESDWLRMRL